MLTITDRAVSMVKTICDGEPLGLRITAIGKGCSGVNYELGLEEAPNDEDAVLEFSGLKVFLDPGSVIQLEGVTMDYGEGAGGEESGFRFDNPKVVPHQCSCSKKCG